MAAKLLRQHFYPPPLPPSKRVSYDRPMTIAAGFCCADGVLLGADTLITDGSTKTYENKIFTCSRFGSYPVVLMAGAGNFPRIKEFADLVVTSKALDDLWSIDDVKQAIRSAVKWEWYQEAVRQTNEIGYNLEFLLSIKDMNGTTGVLHLHNADLYPVQNYCCIGSGATIAKYLAAWLYSQSLPIAVWAELALQVFREAKEHGDGCGGDTHLAPLFNGFEEGNRPNVTTTDTAFLWGLYERLKPLVYGCVNKKIPDEIFTLHMNRFLDHMQLARNTLRERP